MLRIALLITGTTRNYKENYLTWKKYLLDLYNVDIFFHTYNVTGYHVSSSKEHNNIIFDETEVIDILQPIKYIVDSLTDKMEEFKKLVVSQCANKESPKPEFIKAQLYSIYKANELKIEYEKENDFEYDVVIKIRFDTIFNSPFDEEDIMTMYYRNNIVLCGSPYIKVMKYKNACTKCIANFNQSKFIKCNQHNDISDIVIMSKSHIIDFYANIYNKYDEFINIMLANTLSNNNNNLDKYISVTYENGHKIYYDAPKAQRPLSRKNIGFIFKRLYIIELFYGIRY